MTDDVHPALIKPFNIDGKTWYIPHSWNNMVIYYNTKMFADKKIDPPKADWTWDDFLETAKKMTSGEGDKKVFGFGIPYFNFGLTPWLLTNSTYQLSDDWTKSNLNDPKVIEAVTFVHDLDPCAWRFARRRRHRHRQPLLIGPPCHVGLGSLADSGLYRQQLQRF